jgi:hypothetical protein
MQWTKGACRALLWRLSRNLWLRPTQNHWVKQASMIAAGVERCSSLTWNSFLECDGACFLGQLRLPVRLTFSWMTGATRPLTSLSRVHRAPSES